MDYSHKCRGLAVAGQACSGLQMCYFVGWVSSVFAWGGEKNKINSLAPHLPINGELDQSIRYFIVICSFQLSKYRAFLFSVADTLAYNYLKYEYTVPNTCKNSIVMRSNISLHFLKVKH